jgi:hypothetical protein
MTRPTDAIDRALAALRNAVANSTDELVTAAEKMFHAAFEVDLATDAEDMMRAALRVILAAEVVSRVAADVIAETRAALVPAIEETGAPSIRIATHHAIVATSPPAVRVTDLDALPDQFWRQPEPIPDKLAIARALKAGEAVPGATLSNPQPPLRIQARTP